MRIISGSLRGGLSLVGFLLRALLLVMLGGYGAPAAAEEIALFRLIDVGGYAVSRYLDTQRDSENSGALSEQSGYDWRNEIFMTTRSYVYHPNFLTLDIAGGPVLMQGEASTREGTTRTGGELYNLVGRANFLRDKPVRSALLYERLNQASTHANGQVFIEKKSRYGIDLSASDAAVPAPVRAEFRHLESRGSTERTVVDDEQDLFNLGLSYALDGFGDARFRYHASRRESRSGNTGLAIQRTTSDRQSLDLDTRMRFGAAGKHEFINRFSFYEQDDTNDASGLHEQSHFNLMLDLRLKPSASLAGAASYHYYRDDSSRSGTATTQSATTGATWSPSENLELSGALHGEDQRGGSLSRIVYGLNGSINYLRGLPLGRLRAGYSLRHDRYKQQASTAIGEVAGERVELAGTQASPLASPDVIPGSVVVSNATRTQIYQENLDYALTIVGRTTRLQRLVGGRILDGEEVLVDYEHEVGGTFSHARTDHALTLDWVLSQHMTTYLRASLSSAEVLSGNPTAPLNERLSTLFGLRADFPVNPGIPLTVGGRIEREHVVEKISPLRRESVDLYLRTEKPLFKVGFMNLSFRRLVLEYENSIHDVDLMGCGARISARLFGGTLSLVSNYERDRGGPVARDQRNDAVDYEWKVNKLTLAGHLSRQWESQGRFERTNTLVQLSLRRDF